MMLAAVVMQPGIALAADPVFVVSKAVTDGAVPVADPAMGYILLRTDEPTPLHLMRIATAEDSKIYQDLRKRALEKEVRRYGNKLLTYQADMRAYEQVKKLSKLRKPPTEPIKPTDENFEFTPFGLLAGATLGPLNRFAKGEKGDSTYFYAITPGTYRIYGLVMAINPVTGTCYCLGSVKFTVLPGQITDMGRLSLNSGSAPTGFSKTGVLTPPSPSDVVDLRLAGWKRVAADYSAVGKLPNYFGIQIARIAPIVGVISYDRDRIIDLKAAEPAAEGRDPAD